MTSIHLTKDQQLQLCLKRDEKPSSTLTELATWAMKEFSLPKPPGKATVSRILRTKHELQAMWPDCRRLKKKRAINVVLLDSRVVEAIAFICASELRISANQLPRFTRSGWLKHFLARHGLKRRHAHGESNAVDPAAAEVAALALRAVIRNYHPNDVFNINEAAYFYKAVPRMSICLGSAPSLKQRKDRVTFVAATNASGTEKLPLMVLGTSFRPRWIDDRPADVLYVGTRKGWMTVPVFRQWLWQLNDAMRRQGRRVDRLLVGEPDLYTITPLEAVEWLASEWERIPEETIANSWCHSGLLVDKLQVADVLN